MFSAVFPFYIKFQFYYSSFKLQEFIIFKMFIMYFRLYYCLRIKRNTKIYIITITARSIMKKPCYTSHLLLNFCVFPLFVNILEADLHLHIIFTLGECSCFISCK